MRGIWLTLGVVFLIGSFALLTVDFWRFIASSGQTPYLRPADLVAASWVSQVERWADLEGSTWGNVTRLALQPLVLKTPLWVPCLILALVFRLLGRKPS